MVKIILDPSWDNKNNCSDCATSLPYTLTTIHPRKRAKPKQSKAKANTEAEAKAKPESRANHKSESITGTVERL